jgi:signal transduction histidine kinase
MARLYFRIYLAVLGSLALFALLAAAAWRFGPDFDRFGPRPELLAALAEQIAPPPWLPPEEQRRVLRGWRERSGYDLAIYGSDGRLVAGEGAFAAAPRLGALRGRAWSHVAELADGRMLVALRPPQERPLRRFGWLFALVGIGIAVAIAAYPVVRRLTRRLETLQASVAALGAGDLSARVKVEGRDEVGRLAQTFNAAADRIQELVTTNRSLLANASHELRSPLARLRMAVETLPPDAPERTKAEIARNIRELDKLIDEILLASRLGADGEAARPIVEEIDLVGLVAEECAVTDARLDLSGGALPVVRGDPRLLRRLLRNLLDNAERYGGGHPDVTVGRDGDVAVIHVADRGAGVPEAERERIFEPFYRASGAREREGGVGLGLALVREIARKHGGDVVCLPRPGGGSVFRVRLPAYLSDMASGGSTPSGMGHS